MGANRYDRLVVLQRPLGRESASVLRARCGGRPQIRKREQAPCAGSSFGSSFSPGALGQGYQDLRLRTGAAWV